MSKSFLLDPCTDLMQVQNSEVEGVKGEVNNYFMLLGIYVCFRNEKTKDNFGYGTAVGKP